MIIFDDFSYDNLRNLRNRLKNDFSCLKLKDLENKHSADFAVCIFNIEKCFFTSSVLDFLKCQNLFKNLEIILVSNFNENSEAAICFLKTFSELFDKHYKIIAEVDINDEKTIFNLLKKSNNKEMNLNKVDIYTDGACSGNPGAGGWAAILLKNGIQKTISGGEAETTNNRMELMAVIEGLNALKVKCEVEIYSDSAYVVNAFERGWISQWKLNGWKTASKDPVKNIDLWQQLDKKMQEHIVHFNKVKGHSDNKFNNECDMLAVLESQKYMNN